MHENLESGRIHVAVDMLVFTVRQGRLQVLLSRREHLPFRLCWALPGRLIALEESSEAAARRLLAEMLPMQDVYLEQLYTFTALNRDPRGRVISIAYMILLPWRHLAPLLSGGDMRLQAFTVNHGPGELSLSGPEGVSLTTGDLAFDHGQILRTGVSRLQGKIDYTDVSFHFLNDPNAFSLSELQSVFEAVLGGGVDSSNFRRSIRSRYEAAGRIALTAQSAKPARGRPAALYRFVK